MPSLLTYQKEFNRKIFHIFSSIIPILLWFFGKDILLPWILIAAIVFPMIDYLRRKSIILYSIANKIFQNITRPEERNTITGASWVLIGGGITILLFNEKVAIISLLIMSISDSAAAIIGIKYGKTLLYNKSLEGSIGFFIVTYIILTVLTSISFFPILFIAGICTIIELISTKKFNDNLFIPISSGLLLTLLGGVN